MKRWWSLFLSVFLLVPMLVFSERDRVSDNATVDEMFQLGIQQLLENQLELAEVNLKKAIFLEPKNATLYWELGWVYWKKQNWEKVLEVWRSVQNLEPSFPDLPKFFQQAEDSYAFQKKSALSGIQLLHSDWPAGQEGELTLVAVGDVMLGSNYPDSSKMPRREDEKHLLRSVSKALVGDLVFANLEGTLTEVETSEKCGETLVCFAFRSPPRYGALLQQSGFHVLSLANNHAADFGYEGTTETIRSLDQVGIVSFGSFGRPSAVTQANGIQIGFLGVATGPCCVRLNQMQKSAFLVTQLKKKADLVVVSFHGGAEGEKALHTPVGTEYFYGEDRGNVREFAHKMIDAGADLLLGHGPHVLRGMEFYRQKLIAYSLGNFIGYLRLSTRGLLQYSMILRVTFLKDGTYKQIKVVPLKMSPLAIPQFDPDGYSHALLNRLSREDFGTNGVVLDQNGVWER